MTQKTFDEPVYQVTESRLYLRQILTSLGPLLAIIVSGFTGGYSAVLLPQLKSSISLHVDNSTTILNDSDEIRVSTIEEESWIASAAVLPMAPGCWLAGFLMEILGRRKLMMLVPPLFVIGWLTVGLASNFTYLIIGRLICGLSVGLLGPLAPVYISETSDPLLRGILLGGITLALSAGILVIHAIGTWLHWRTMVYICVMYSALCWLICLPSRESPVWLVNKGLFKEARESWIYFRGEDCMEEYYILENTRIKDTRENVRKRSMLSSLKKTMSSRHFLKPLGILLLFFFTAQFAGTNVVIFYSVGMLADVTGPENAYWGSLILDAIRLILSAITCYLVRKWNRRFLTFLSGFGTTFTLLLLSLFLFLEIENPWVSAILLALYTAFLPLGLIPLPWMLCGELFPRKFRGLGSGLTSGFTFICFFVVVKVAPAMFAELRPHGTFAIYGVVTLLGTSLLYLTLPETKDKTLEEIERAFDKKPSNKLATKKTEVPMVERVAVNGGTNEKLCA